MSQPYFTISKQECQAFQKTKHGKCRVLGAVVRGVRNPSTVPSFPSCKGEIKRGIERKKTDCVAVIRFCSQFV